MRFLCVPLRPAKICHLNRSLQYAEEKACWLSTIAQCGKNSAMDHSPVPLSPLPRRHGQRVLGSRFLEEEFGAHSVSQFIFDDL